MPTRFKLCNFYFNLGRAHASRNFLVFRRSRWRPKDSRPSVRMSVRTSVRTYVTLLLENRSLLFYETLHLVRACKGGKNVPSAFLKKILFRPFWPKTVQNGPFLAKMPKNGGFFAFFSESLHYFFLKLCS